MNVWKNLSSVIWAEALADEASTHIMTSLRKLCWECVSGPNLVCPKESAAWAKGFGPPHPLPLYRLAFVSHTWHRITKSPDFIHRVRLTIHLKHVFRIIPNDIELHTERNKYRLYHKVAWGLSIGSWFYKLLIPEEVGHGCMWSLRNLIKPVRVSRLSFKCGGLNFVLTPKLMVRI